MYIKGFKSAVEHKQMFAEQKTWPTIIMWRVKFVLLTVKCAVFISNISDQVQHSVEL